MRAHGFGVLMMLLSAALAFGSAAAAVAASLRGRRPRFFGHLALLVGTWGTVYVALLLGVSLTSQERVLAAGEVKRFCGFYLDCHRQIGLVSIDVLDSLGSTKPEGRFHVVTLRIASDARAAALRLVDPRLAVLADDGRGRRRFARSSAGEAALARVRGPQHPLTGTLGPGTSYTTAVVFDLPREARDPQLRISEGFWAERLVELFLIGDEDSLLHRRTSWQLAA